jgi:triose/dihydroxyacetone kinase / FAD-AMP lyase (cyclizing)
VAEGLSRRGEADDDGCVSHFINDPETIVTEAIDAEIALANGALRRLDGSPAIKVVVRADVDRTKVAVVSGGGAGHEPAHVGFVGDGMLTAAVSGEIFASPSVDAVLAAILSVTGPAGCLLVVKNYTGDRLNFGLAASKARAMGLAVEMVIVGDDVAIEGAQRPRGVAGTLFVHKVAGHVAREGRTLAEVKAAAERVAAAVVSIGVSLSSCTIPGRHSENRIGEGKVELGLGIHGEPGASIVPLAAVRDLAATMVRLLEARLPAAAPVALLVNDLGGVPPIEMSIATRATIDALAQHEVRLVFGPGRLMTSLDMKGFSVSALPLTDPSIEAELLSAVAPRAWPSARSVANVMPLALPAALVENEERASTHPERRRILESICEALIAKQSELDALDAKVGDGDTGTTLATAARALVADLDRLPLSDASQLCAAVSRRLSRGMGGSSGILLAIFTAAVGASVGDPPAWAHGLAEGARRMKEYGGAKLGERTLLDALEPALTALATGDLAAAARAAREGAARTATMTKAGAGRSSYVPADALRGVPDPGAIAVAAVFEALAGEG